MPTADETYADAKKCIQEKRFADAIQSLEQTIQEDSQHLLAHESLAGLCFLTKNYDRAIQLFQRVQALDPKNIGALVNVGALQNKKKDYTAAVKTLRLALSKDRRCPEAYYNLGIAQRGLHQNSMAVSAYKEAIRLRPDFVEAYTNLGNVLLEMKNHSQAILQFRKALEVQPDFERAKIGLCAAQEQTEQAKSAISPFGRLVDMEQVEKMNRTVAKHLHLTPQQRFEDREDVHKLAKDSELQAIELLKQIKEELSPIILELSRLSSEETSGRIWEAGLKKCQAASRRFSLCLENLNETTDKLTEHEKEIQRYSE
ncbi:tetratricopeptide repeat protein [Thalassoglobus polymorphus]|uniref:Tetratricopeptide repeat protein n=2 Tax=Thalassoglobus polymorphus TaxID=2527994 RepID=A0A517QKB6_9PLAN|nr:tetratricopeptide repeat protein [Thalassoglobus polymorphus]